jgi:signal transduction histidine kinase
MKKIIMMVTIICLLALSFVILNSSHNEVYDYSYKVAINRIGRQLTTDYEMNLIVIDGLSKETLGAIKSVEIVHDIDGSVEDIWHDPIVYMPIEGSTDLAKYTIDKGDYNEKHQNLLLALVVMVAYLFVMMVIYILHRNIIRPMEKISGMTKELAAGNINEMSYPNKGKHFQDFIWGLDRLREELIYERNKNADLEKQRKTLVAGLSHDIKTPLSSVKNYTIAMLEGVYDTKEGKRKALHVILDNTLVIEGLTNDLLASSSQSMKEIKTKVEEVYLKEVHKRLTKLIENRISLLHMTYIEPHIEENPMLLVDLDRLVEVFLNLIENALKYGDLEALSVTYKTEENCQLIELHNSGNQIPESELKYIFTSYYRGSNAGDKPGYGLGLYMSKKIMKAMAGDIFIKNTQSGVSAVLVIKQAG